MNAKTGRISVLAKLILAQIAQKSAGPFCFFCVGEKESEAEPLPAPSDSANVIEPPLNLLK
jgi:hypothetical protein